MYSGVPTMAPPPVSGPSVVWPLPSCTTLAMPKSVMTTRVDGAADSAEVVSPGTRRTLLLLKSRWMTPAACAAASPQQSCCTRGKASPVVNRPSRAMRWLRVSPSRSSMVRKWMGTPAAVVASKQLVDVADIGMAHPTGEQHFAAEALHGCCVGSDAPTDDLQRHPRAQHDVVGLVDGAHASAGDEAENGEAARQRLARLQTRKVGIAARCMQGNAGRWQAHRRLVWGAAGTSFGARQVTGCLGGDGPNRRELRLSAHDGASFLTGTPPSDGAQAAPASPSVSPSPYLGQTPRRCSWGSVRRLERRGRQGLPTLLGHVVSAPASDLPCAFAHRVIPLQEARAVYRGRRRVF